jgi:membrane protease YdiL (CAAX protease family)
MNAIADPRPALFARILRFPLIRLGVLYVLLSYQYLAGYFFKASMTHGSMQAVAATLMMAVLLLGSYAVFVRLVERRPVSELALGRMGRELGLGALLGAGLFTAIVVVLIALGVYRIEGLNDWRVLPTGIAVAISAGVYEEVLFRGGLFRIAEEVFGSWAALLISSVVFGFTHITTEGATLQGAVSISLWAGVLLAAPFMLTGRLWTGIGIHSAWNYTQGTVFSGVVSGNAGTGHGLVKATIQGPDLLTGGSFGFEASLIALFVARDRGPPRPDRAAVLEARVDGRGRRARAGMTLLTGKAPAAA